MKIRIALIAAAALAATASGAFAATVSATAPVTVILVAPVNITKTQDMNFGQIVRPSNADSNTVNLDTTNTVTLSGAGNGSVIATPTTSAKFNIVAAPATTYTLTTSLAFTLPGLLGVGVSTPAASTGTVGTIPAGGTQEIRFGANFDINSGTPTQTYSGTLSVTVNYG